MAVTGLVKNEDGTLKVAQVASYDSPTEEQLEATINTQENTAGGSRNEQVYSAANNGMTPASIGGLPSQFQGCGSPTIAINIELHLPATDNPDVYDQLFKSLRKNLLSSEDDD